MKVIISGGSGMVGSHIIPLLLHSGCTVVNLTTRKTLVSEGSSRLIHHYWDPKRNELDPKPLQGASAVINLAGFSISERWTTSNKKKMYESRIQSTRLLVRTVMSLPVPPKVFISASASGFYPPSDHIMSEESAPGNNFLSGLVMAWEQELDPLRQTDIRLVIPRLGVVLNKEEGAVARMVPFFRLGLGSPAGNGKQLMSWIHLADLGSFIVRALETDAINGVYNLCSPHVVSNRLFSAELAKAMQKPFFLPAIPTFMLRLLFGEMSSLVINSSNMDCSKLISSGFVLRYARLPDALHELFSETRTT